MDWNRDQVVIGKVNVCNTIHWNGIGIQECSVKGGQRDVLPHEVVHFCHLECQTRVDHSEWLVTLIQAEIIKFDQRLAGFNVRKPRDDPQGILAKQIFSHRLRILVNEVGRDSVAQVSEVSENIGAVVLNSPLHCLRKGRKRVVAKE